MSYNFTLFTFVNRVRVFDYPEAEIHTPFSPEMMHSTS